MYNLFKKNKINLQVHYKPIHFYEYYKKKYNFSENSFPISKNSMIVFFHFQYTMIYQVIIKIESLIY